MALPDKLYETLTSGVYSGAISVFDLPAFLYAWTLDELDRSFFSGYALEAGDSFPVFEKAANFRANIARFSGAKTFQQTKDLTAFVFDENGFKRPFAEFKKFARGIDDNYNKNWLAAEQDSVVLQSQNARKWLKYEDEADLFPIIEYVTVGDERVRPEHAKLNGLKLPVNDPLWNRIHPQNGWRCRCTTLQHASSARTSSEKTTSKTRPMLDEFKKRPEFDYNPGQSDFIFKEKGKGKHSYFKVPREFKPELSRNFGFGSASEVTGRQI